MLSSTNAVLRKSQITGILEYICQGLELTESQFANAQSKYQAVGGWLADSNIGELQSAVIYPQGSVSIQTTVKPLYEDEYDVDLVCYIPSVNSFMAPQQLKKIIGDRLRENAIYKERLEEKARCWRLNYANEFHMDITPSITNPHCNQGGELVPDKVLQAWKPSNPRGYQAKFTRRAALQPRLLLLDAKFAEARAQVEALPVPTKFKGILRRTIQLCKRHRDVVFSETDSGLAPISVIITTLAALSYEYCVQNKIYETEVDVFFDVVKYMPNFIEKNWVNGKEQYCIWNESTAGENFAEKWNENPELAKAFYSWHAKALVDFERISSLNGLDVIQENLSLSFGEKVANKAMTLILDTFGAARKNGALIVAPNLGLTIGAAHGAVVRPNTFFGN